MMNFRKKIPPVHNISHGMYAMGLEAMDCFIMKTLHIKQLFTKSEQFLDMQLNPAPPFFLEAPSLFAVYQESQNPCTRKANFLRN